MRGKWKRLLVMLLVTSMLLTDSSLSEVVYAAGQSQQQETAEQSEESAPSQTDKVDENMSEGDTDSPSTSDENVNDVDTGDANVDDADTGAEGTNADNPVTGDEDAVDADTEEPQEQETEASEADLSIHSMDEKESVDGPLTETQQAILEKAENVYGGESAHPLVSYFYALDKEESYKAGQEIALTVTQKLHPVEMYNYNSGALPLAKQIDQMKVTLTLPEGLTCTRYDLKENDTYLESCTIDESGRKLTLTYNESCPIPGNDVSSAFFIYVRIDGNGTKQDGETVSLRKDGVDIQTEFSAVLPVLDLSGAKDKVIGEVSVTNGFFVDESEFLESITVNSPDRWGTIVNTDTHEENKNKNWYYDENGNIVMTWTVAAALENPEASGDDHKEPFEKLYLGDAELLQALTGEEEGVAQLQANHNLTMYAQPGRAPLDEFALFSKVYAKKGEEIIYPDNLTLEIVNKDGQTVKDPAEDKLKTEASGETTLNGVTLENYATAQGYLDAAGTNETGMDAGTPWYSTYKVTAVFSKEKFISHFYDKIESYHFINEVTLKSKISSVKTQEAVQSSSEAEGVYKDATIAYPVDLAQSIAMGLGVDFLYDEENLDGILSPFTGTSTYKLQKKNGDQWEDYWFFTNNKPEQQADIDYQKNFTIASPEEGNPAQHLGKTTIYVEEGTYRLQKVQTTMGSDVAELLGCSGSGNSEDASGSYEFTTEGPLSEEHQELYVHYKAKGERILFRLADKDNGEKMLPGAEYTLYKDGQAVKTSVSTAQGCVVFAALEKDAEYTVKQTKAPKGYILDETEYTVHTGDTAANSADEYGAHYPKYEDTYFPTLTNENNHYSGQVAITKYISTFVGDQYTDEQAVIENNAV